MLSIAESQEESKRLAFRIKWDSEVKRWLVQHVGEGDSGIDRNGAVQRTPQALPVSKRNKAVGSSISTSSAGQCAAISAATRQPSPPSTWMGAPPLSHLPLLSVNRHSVASHMRQAEKKPTLLHGSC